MSVRPILSYSHPLVKKRAEHVDVVDESVRKVIEDLADTLYSTTGVGLAAPQIGSSRAIIIYDPNRNHRSGERTYCAILNPRIVQTEGGIMSTEGCKSVAQLKVDVPRAQKILVEGLDQEGKAVRIDADGFAAIVLQHEIDHLNGVVITDQLSPPEHDSYVRRIEHQRRRDEDPFFAANLAAIHQRLARLRDHADGVVLSQNTRSHEIVVVKENDQIRLFFGARGESGRSRQLSGIMSRVSLVDPLDLLGEYTRVMMLSLVWKPSPDRVYVLGFGGGRVPMIFHHYFPQVVVENTETEPIVLRIAQQHFGIKLDGRMSVAIEDGRKYLARQAPEIAYDIIIIDGFTGTGDHPNHLATFEFYELCKRHLTPGGVVLTNLVENDPLWQTKVDTFGSAFRQVVQYAEDGACVLFGSDRPPFEPGEIVERARDIYERCNFPFPLSSLASRMRPMDRRVGLAGLAGLLRDQIARDLLSKGDPIFSKLGRNDPCPCGSGKKFKKCHGG